MTTAMSIANAARFHDIHVSLEDRIATLTMDGAVAGGSLTHRMAGELVAALDMCDADEAVRVVILTATGRHFCVGAALAGGRFETAEKEAAERGEAATPRERGTWREPIGIISLRMMEMTKPIIVAMNGNAVGGGITLTLAADFRLAVPDAKFGFVFTRRGITPEGVSHWLLPRLVGFPVALDWMLTGRLFGAAEAVATGLVHSVHEPAHLPSAARAIATDLAENTSPIAVAATRQMLYRTPLAEPSEVHALESRLIKKLTRLPDATEGVKSFLERRQPAFSSTVADTIGELLPWGAERRP